MSGDPFESARRRMVEDQLAARGIRAPEVLAAFLRVPRHRFVPEAEQTRAYEDHPLPIGGGQTISQPYMVACMTEALAPRAGDRILEVGTGSGYQTAILLELGARVFSVEIDPELASEARGRLERLGYSGARFKVGDGSLGWPEEAPFDGVIVTAGAPSLPGSLTGQLGAGGRMVIPVGGEDEQELLLVRRTADGIERRRMCGCIFVKLRGAEGW